jgi:hypothetical protein
VHPPHGLERDPLTGERVDVGRHHDRSRIVSPTTHGSSVDPSSSPSESSDSGAQRARNARSAALNCRRVSR